jgi:hypothetical protein
MWMKAWTWLTTMDGGTALLWGLVLAAAFEAVTCVFRFGLGMQSTMSTSFLAPFTLGYRIHHGYIGALMLLPVTVLPSGGLRSALIIVGTGLFVSDIVHHFLVLWPITGSPCFDFRYPGQ